MIVSDTVSLALRNLRQAKLRTSLTVIGVAIGIASLAGMVSLGVGLEEQTVGRFMSAGVFDSVSVLPAQFGGGGPFAFGARGGRGGGRGRGQNTAQPETPRKALDDEAVEEISKLPDVKEVYPNITVPVEIQFEQYQSFATVVGVPMSQRDTGAFQTFTAGSFFGDDKTRACLLSLDFAKRITDKDPSTLIGQAITVAYAATPATAPADGTRTPAAAPALSPDAALLAGMAGQAGLSGVAIPRRVTLSFIIAGIVERPAGGLALGATSTSGLMIPLEQAKTINAEAVTGRQSLLSAPSATPAKKTYNALTVKVARASAVQDVEDKITALGFTPFSAMDAIKNAKRVFVILDIILGLIGSIALAVSSLGIVNTMVMSILERTREIGIMKAIGGSDADVRGIFLVEASAIGFLGGISGVALGWIVGRIINFGANVYLRSQQAGGPENLNLFSLPLWLVGGAIGFSIFVSLIAGSFPARRAARLDPIQALRHD